jgi:UDP:flavonoid glycosyltransferase YjiC (YdhE family)
MLAVNFNRAKRSVMAATPPSSQRMAYFISPHGYGHAARAAAIMAALHQQRPAVHFEIFTQVPAWFFADSLPGNFSYHSVLTDIGLAQKNSLVEDLPQTLQRLAKFIPFESDQIEKLAEQVQGLGCSLILCDISPLGLAVARAAGLPSILVENFIWDWIYQGYAAREPEFEKYIVLFQSWFKSATYHIQTEPICQPNSASLTTEPVSRPKRTPANLTRQKLGLPAEARAILLTMGGIPWDYSFLVPLLAYPDYYFIIPGGSEQPEIRQNLVLLPHHSQFFHPDLVHAADAVVGKLGYSTLAEVYHAGIPFGYIPRPGFRESEVMSRYVDRYMSGVEITAAQFENGAWLAVLPELLALPRLNHTTTNGAEQAAQFIGNLLK